MTYLIHKHESLRYFEACGNMTGMRVFNLDKSAAKVIVGVNCSFVVNGKDYYGPGPRNMDSSNTIFISGPIVAKNDEEMESLARVVTLDIETLPVIEESPLAAESKQVPSREAQEIEELKVRVGRSIRETRETARKLENLPSLKIKGWSYKNMLMIMESVVFDLLAILLLLAAVRSGLYMYVAPVTFTILPKGAHSLPFLDADSFPWSSVADSFIPFDSNDLIDYLPIVKLILFLVIISILWTRVFAMRVKMSSHKAEMTVPVRQRFHLLLTFTRECRSYFSTRQQVISIRYPICRQFDAQTVGIVCMEKMSLFYNSTHAKALIVIAPIHCRGLNLEGRYTCMFDAEIIVEWEKLTWTVSPSHSIGMHTEQ